MELEPIHSFRLEQNSTNYDRKENRYQGQDSYSIDTFDRVLPRSEHKYPLIDSYRQRSHEETNEERRERKAAAKRKLEKLSEDRRRKKQKDEHKAIRPSKGNNAYASGSKVKLFDINHAVYSN